MIRFGRQSQSCISRTAEAQPCKKKKMAMLLLKTAAGRPKKEMVCCWRWANSLRLASNHLKMIWPFFQNIKKKPKWFTKTFHNSVNIFASSPFPQIFSLPAFHHYHHPQHTVYLLSPLPSTFWMYHVKLKLCWVRFGVFLTTLQTRKKICKRFMGLYSLCDGSCN